MGITSKPPPQFSSPAPSCQISFLPLVQSLDVDNIMKLFAAVLLEKRILLRASK